MRKVFLENIERYNNKGLKWETAIGERIRFVFDDIDGEFEILDYDKDSQKVTLQYNYSIFNTSTNNLIKAQIKRIIGVKTATRTDFKYRVNEEVNCYLILDRYRERRNNVTGKRYKVKCKKCGSITDKSEQGISTGCAVCRNRLIIPGVNNCEATNKEIYNAIVDKDVAMYETATSHKKVRWKCPNCGNINVNEIYHLFNDRTGCNYCDDGISFPEKVLYNVFSYISNTFEIHKHFLWSNGKEYDLYDNGIFVEIHGQQHYKKAFSNGRKLQEEKMNDEYKKELASVQSCYRDYVVIDASKATFEQIKDNIIASKLKDYYDLLLIDWDNVRYRSSISIIHNVVDLFNNGYTLKDISYKLKIHISTVYKYLHKGNELGICSFNPDYANLSCSKSVLCLNTNQVFKNAREAKKYCGLKSGSGIARACKNPGVYAGKHPITNEPLYWQYVS